MIRNKTILLATIALCIMLTACSKKAKYDPNTYVTPEEQDSILYRTIRYSAKPPPGSTQQTKFNAEFDPYYKRAVTGYRFLFLLREEDGTINYFISRPAKSITLMFEGIGGKLKLNMMDSLIEYDEVFRTWKMPDKELNERGRLLFDRMVTKRDLTIFYPKYTGDKYIEFPDGRFTFDKKNRIWIDNVPFDSMKTSRN